MQEKTNELKASSVDIPKNPAESYRKTLFNYDLEINNAINLSELYASQVSYYQDDLTAKGKKIYYSAVVNLKKIEAYLVALKKGKNNAWERLDRILSTYNPKRKKIRIMYFISGYSVRAISEAIPYELRNLKRIIKGMREELITYLPFEEFILKDNELEEDEEESQSQEIKESDFEESNKNGEWSIFRRLLRDNQKHTY